MGIFDMLIPKIDEFIIPEVWTKLIRNKDMVKFIHAAYLVQRVKAVDEKALR